MPTLPLQESIRLVREAAMLAGEPSSIMVGVSGGKDSLATLDICCRAFDHVEAFFMFLVDGLECVEAPVHAAVRRFGVKLHKVPHWQFSHYLRNAVLMPHQTGAAKLRLQKIGDVEAALHRRTAIRWFGYGWRKDESVTRRVTLKRWGNIWLPREGKKLGKVYPIAEWHARDVIGYLRVRGIPIPERLGAKTAYTGSGFDLSVPCLQMLRDHYPADWARVVKVFKFAPAMLARAEMFPPKPKEKR